MKILLEDPVPIRDRRPDLPEGLAAIIHRSLARDPQARYPNVREMRRASSRSQHDRCRLCPPLPVAFSKCGRDQGQAKPEPRESGVRGPMRSG